MKALVLVFAGLLFSNSASCQITTGGIQGRLLGKDGSSIANANLSLSSPALLGERGTSSDTEGAFLFRNLPIGTYHLTINHVSYKRNEISDILVQLGVVTNLGTIVMEEGQTGLDTVTVTASKPVLSRTAEISHSVTRSNLDKLPVGRDFKEVITILPQVNTSYYGDGLSIAGGTGSENFFYVDGTNVTSIYSPPGQTGTFTITGFLPYNFIKEIKVSSGGFEAQYGKALGGNVDVVTQSGSNDFHGQVFGFLSGNFLNSTPKGGTSGSAVDKTSNYDGGISFGGPIIKDKLWYYVAYSYYANERGVEVKGHGFYPDKVTNHVVASKFDWRVSPASALNLTIIANPSTSTPVWGYSWWYLYPDSIVDPESVQAKYESGGVNAILNGHSTLRKSTELDYSVTYYNHRAIIEGISQFGSDTPQYYDLTTNTLSGGLGWKEDNKLSKFGGRIAVSHKLGSHEMKLGIESEVNSLSGNNYTPGSGVILYDGSKYTLTYVNVDNTLNSASHTGYLQDNWSVGKRLVLQLGFRWDGLALQKGETVYQEFNNQYQPRLGISWFLDEAETKRISLYYGRVYQWVSPLYGRVYTQSSLVYDSLYVVDPRSPGAVPYDGATYYQPSETPQFNTGKYDLDNMDQFSAEYQQEFTPRLQLRVRGMYKYLRDGFFYSLDSSNSYQGVVGNPGKGTMSFLPPATREYLALEIGLTGESMSGFRYSLFYTLSRNYGNYAGGYLAEDQVPVFAGFGSGVNTQAAIPNSTGYLPNDRTHSLKLTASYSFKFGLTAGTYLTIQSGTPLSIYAPGPFLNSRVNLVQRGTSGRTPTLWDLNFRFSYQHKGFPAKFYFDVFHVGDPQTVVNQDQNKFNDMAQTIANTNFSKPISYQPPMAIRIGAEFNF